MNKKSTIASEGTGAAATEELRFDVDALREKYRVERDKRLRADGNDQYLEVSGDLRHFSDDPYIDEEIVRDPIVEDLDVAIIGGGFGGLIAAAHLQKVGVDSIRVIEKAGDFGGTWYWNRYPGAQCDIESYIYLPLLEETGYIPKEKYSYAPEILAHAQRIGKHFNLYERACFQTQVDNLRWDEATGRWVIKTDRGDVLNARFVVMSSGPLNRPKLPAIPGIVTFKGHTFHTSRWDYDYTGGGPLEPLGKLKDKRVGIVGTGATAIQCVPYLGKSAKELFVFQRTPSAIDDRGNKPTDPEWVKTLKPGWQAERNYNFTAILSAVPQEEDLVNDRWTDLFKALSKIMTPQKGSELSPEKMALKAELADYEKMNYIRDRVGRTVDNAETAEALMPWYRQWCKRPTFNDEYLPTFNLPNVSLVDTDGKGVERVTETSVVVNGVEYEVDCLIFATGFEVGTAYTRRSEFEVFGRDGVSLADYWADGMKTFHGLYSHGFPNCFHLGLTQTGLSPCFTYMLDGQSTHIAYIVQQVMKGNAKSVEATLEAENKWQDIVGRPSFMSNYLSHCTPGYYNGEGQSGKGKGFLEGQYGEGAVQFYDMLARWREQDQMEGVVVE